MRIKKPVRRYEAEISEALALIVHEPREAVAKLLEIRRRALRAGGTKNASTCLVALLFATGVAKEPELQLKCARRLAREDPRAPSFLALGRIEERLGHPVRAKSAYTTALILGKRERDLDDMAEARESLERCAKQ